MLQKVQRQQQHVLWLPLLLLLLKRCLCLLVPAAQPLLQWCS
jgi:hypothetical protein